MCAGEFPITLKEAEQLFRQILSDRERILGHQHPDALNTRYWLARVIADQGRHKEAEQLFRQILRDRERVLGHQHPDTAATRSQLTQITSSPAVVDEG